MTDKPDGKPWLDQMLTVALILGVTYLIAATLMDYLMKDRYAIGGAAGNPRRVVQPVTGQHHGLNRDQVLAIVKRVVKEKGEWVEGIVFEEPRLLKDGWDILVRLGSGIGDDRLIHINPKGKVLYIHGL